MKFCRISSVLVRRAVSVCMACLMLTAVYPVFRSSAAVSAADVAYETKTVYHWKRVRKQSDVPEDYNDYCIISWSDGTDEKNRVYTKGATLNSDRVEGAYESDDPYILIKRKNYDKNADPDQYTEGFTTASVDGLWRMQVVGTDGDNGDDWKVKLYNSEGGQLYDKNNWLGFNSDGTHWTLSTADDDSSSYGEEISAGHVCFVHNRTGGKFDRYLDDHGKQMTINESDTAWDYDTCSFLLYIVEREEYSAIGTMELASGSVLQLKNNTFLKDDATLTIQPGAVLTVKDTFFNNGKIINYGTLIIEEDSVMCPFDTTKAAGGSVCCYGSGTTYKGMKCEGNLIILSGGRLLLTKDSAGFILEKGASLNNFGLLFVPGSMNINSAQVYCSEQSFVISHFKPTHNLGILPDITIDSVEREYYQRKSVYSFLGVSPIQNLSCKKTSASNNFYNEISYLEYPIHGWLFDDDMVGYRRAVFNKYE